MSTTTYNISNSGSGAYTINGLDNSTINLYIGRSYTFTINATNHPFWIQTTTGEYTPANVYIFGVTNNGTENGTLTFNVPLDAPNTLYYVCANHPSMNGTINITNDPDSVPISNICFLKGTPVVTDQGIIEIQDITNKNTINNLKVKCITQTTSNYEYLVCIEKDIICENVPSQKTVITRNHKIFYNGYLVDADTIPNISMIQYNGEKLYNVLLEENGLMLVNNMICETLDINNVIAKLYEHPNKNGITKTLNSIINTGNMELYKKTAIELLLPRKL